MCDQISGYEKQPPGNSIKAYEKKIINGITFILIDIYKAYKAMTHELRLKKGLIYPSTKV